jgi:hypothetical protein
MDVAYKFDFVRDYGALALAVRSFQERPPILGHKD